MSYSSIVSAELATALVTLPRIVAADLYLRCKPLIGNVTLVQFRLDVSKWISDNKNPNHIPGYESRKGPTGGFYKKGSPTELITKNKSNIEQNNTDSTLSEDSVSEGMFTLQISPTLRIAQNDDRNWTIQKKSGETWINKCYHGDLIGVLNSAVKHIINGEFKLSNNTAIQLKDLSIMINEMENRLTDQLQKSIKERT